MRYEVGDAAVQGRNIRFTSLLTVGESWHNDHHAFPGSARLGLFAGEWDPGWWSTSWGSPTSVGSPGRTVDSN
jgi:fatty-acid desaturase